MTDIVIRQATQADIEGIQALALALFKDPTSASDTHLDNAWPIDNRGRSAFEEAITSQTHILLVADRNERVVGYLYGEILELEEWRPVRTSELGSFYVLPEIRGHKVGEQLTRRFLEWSRNESAKIAKVTAYADNERGISFYKTQGFIPESLNMEVEL